MIHQRLAGHPAAGDDVEHARRQAGLFGETGEFDGGGGGDFGGLDDDGVAGGQGRGDAHDGEEGGGVPRHDHRDDAERFGCGVVEHADAVERDDAAFDLIGEAAEVVEPVLHDAGLGAHFREQLAVLLGFQGGDQVGVFGDQVAPAHQQPATAGWRELAPGAVERRRCRTHGGVDVGCAGFDEAAERLAGGGVDGFECLAVAAGLERAVHEVGVV